MKSYTCVVSGSQTFKTNMCYAKQIVQGYLKEMLDTNDEIPLIIHEREPALLHLQCPFLAFKYGAILGYLCAFRFESCFCFF